MKSIVAVDKNWGIGKNNGLLFSLPEDMKFFRTTTNGKTVCMGYNTLLSFPQGKPLNNRVNIVLAPVGVEREDCIVVHTVQDMLAEIKKYNQDDVFVIGGAMFYKTMLPYCSQALVTKVDADGEATVFYENLDNLPEWEMISSSSTIQTNGYNIRFTVYQNKLVKAY